MGEYPFVAYRYVLETRAGWHGSIGSAEIIVILPYKANHQNVIIGDTTGWSQTTPGANFGGNQVIWHFEDFEPTLENNIEILVVMSNVWRKVLEERARVVDHPKDGEAWGRLGKLYKKSSYLRNWFREDDGGKELFFLSMQAYENALELLPDDALWHVGFADLLWKHAYWDVFQPGSPNLDEITHSMPGAVNKIGDTYKFLMLTTTPTIVPRRTLVVSARVTQSSASTLVSSSPSLSISTITSPKKGIETTNTPAFAAQTREDELPGGSSTPFCSPALLVIAAMEAVLSFRYQKQSD